MCLKLYSFAKSSCSWRVRICLALKDLEYTHASVDLLKGDQHLDDFRKLNPIGQVPALVDNEICITQSVAIMEYLEEKYRSSGLQLLPDDFQARAQVREVTELVNSGIQPLQNLSVLKKVGAMRKREWAEYWITAGFKALEQRLSRTSGTYSVGDSITIADACIAPQCKNATERFRIDLLKYPNLNKVNNALLNHPAFVLSSPESMAKSPV